DSAGAHRIHQNTLRCEVVRQRLNEGVLRSIDDGRGNGVCLRDLAGLTDNHDEAPAARLHDGHDLPCQLPDAQHFGPEMAKQGLAWHFVDAARQMRASIAHDNINAPKSPDYTGDQRGDIVRPAYISQETLGVRSTERRDGCIEAPFVAPANRNHAAFGRELLGTRKSDTACPA